MSDIDKRYFEGLSERYLRAELVRLQKIASEASAGIGALKAELMHRACKNSEPK